ncbi:hypothetical protein GCM10010420_53610 [Streptomyces glaucosporus]|uniref:HEAT repeat domain-containing protein n=1 Tax=Streptomyces glaucosporus TaxID=284044 RepID=A0ABP5W0G1_9ACTN
MTVGIRIALKSGVSLESVQAFAWDQNWNITAATREDERPTRFGWETIDGKTSVSYVEDPYIGISYLTVTGVAVEEVSQAVRASLETWTFAEAMSLLAGAVDRDTKIRGIYISAVSAVRREIRELISAYRGLAGDPDADIRHALLVGIGYTGVNVELRALAEDLHRNDPDEEVRRDAGYLIEGLNLPNTP